MRASTPAALVVPNEAIAIDERRCRQERHERSRDDGTDQQYRFARSLHLILQLDAIHLCAFHGSSPKLSSTLETAARHRRLGSALGRVSSLPSGVRRTVTVVTSAVTAAGDQGARGRIAGRLATGPRAVRGSGCGSWGSVPGPRGSSTARRRRVCGGSSRCVARGVGARARAGRARGRSPSGRGCGGARRHAPAVRHGAHGTRPRLDQTRGASPRGSRRDAGARVGGGRPQL